MALITTAHIPFDPNQIPRETEMLSRVQEKDMEMVSISLVCLKSSGCLRVTQIKRTCISGRGDILSV